MIELEGVTKRYEKDSHVVHALAEVSLRIDQGEFVAVAGPSGSGKSTLLNVVGLLDRPDEGVYRLGGRDVSALGGDELAAIRNRELGFVFQAFHVLPKTPAIENVELPLIYSDRRDIAGLARRALERVGLADWAAHVPSELSGGQQQRVAIARALINEPKVILADEPTGNLDSASGLEILRILQELNDQGTTIVLVTHDHALSNMARRLIELVDGRIVRDERIAQRRDAKSALAEAAKA